MAMLLGILVCLFMAGAVAAAPADDLHRFCRQVRNDDTIRDYSPRFATVPFRRSRHWFRTQKARPAIPNCEHRHNIAA
ncbi:hypothetical protein ACVDG5_027880 [Mesorhizobium sp. ORM6]